MLRKSAHSSGPDQGQAAENLAGPPSPLRRFGSWHLLALAILVVAVCLFRWPLLFGGYSFLDVGPLPHMTIPDLEFRAHALRAGSVPIWSNYQRGGQAFLGELLPNVLNPLSYALLAMPLSHGHIDTSYFLDYYVFLQCLAAISAYFLLIDLQCSRWAAVLAGLFYAIAGPPGNSYWLEFVTEVIYTPLVLLFLFRSLRGLRPLANCAIAGAITGVSWFSGTHHFALITSISCFVALLSFSVGREWKRGLLRVAVFACTVFFVGAPQLLPSIEFNKNSVRWVGAANDPSPGSARVPYEAHLHEYLRPSHLLDILFGLDQAYWGAGMVFAGVVSLAFVPFAVRSLASTRLLQLLVALALAGILLSMSAWDTLYGVAYLIIPAFDKLRESLTWILLAHVAWTCFFGIGLTRFFSASDGVLQQGMRRLFFVAGPVLLTAAYFFTLLGTPEFHDMADRLGIAGLAALLVAVVLLMADRGWAKPAICFCLLGAVMMIEQGNVSGRFLPRDAESAKRFSAAVAADDEIARFLKTRSDLVRIDVDRDDVPENFGEMHGIEELSGHGASMLTSLYQLPYDNPRARQLYGVNYFVAKKPADSSQQLLYTSGPGIKVFSSPGAMPRVRAVHSVIQVRNGDEARSLLQDPAFDLSQAFYLDHKFTAPVLENCPASGDRVSLLERNQWRVRIQATLQCTGAVVLSDNFYPGWRAYVDGKRAALLPAYGSLRGVVVMAGNHAIEMLYVPLSFYLGIALFVIGVAGTITLWRSNETPRQNLLTERLQRPLLNAE
jgi:hypothetical protein